MMFTISVRCFECDASVEQNYLLMLADGWDPFVTIQTGPSSYLDTVLCPKHSSRGLRSMIARKYAKGAIASGDGRIGRISKTLTPHLGSCGRCFTTWAFVKSHTTYYTDGRGCFPLCEACWHELSPSERVPFYRDLMEVWQSQGRNIDDDWPRVEYAVLNEDVIIEDGAVKS